MLYRGGVLHKIYSWRPAISTIRSASLSGPVRSSHMHRLLSTSYCGHPALALDVLILDVDGCSPFLTHDDRRCNSFRLDHSGVCVFPTLSHLLRSPKSKGGIRCLESLTSGPFWCFTSTAPFVERQIPTTALVAEYNSVPTKHRIGGILDNYLDRWI